MRGVPTSLTESQALFLRWLLDEGSSRGPSAIRAEHPELAEELSALWRSFCSVRASCSALAVEPPTSPVEATVSELLRSFDLEASEEARNRIPVDSSSEAAAPIHQSNYSFDGEVLDGDPPRVVVVRDENLGRPLVMKVHREEAGGEASLRAFLREAALLGRLDHPGVPSVHEIGIDRDGRAFFTMPFQRGVVLRRMFDQVRRGDEAWTASRVLGVVLQVCDTLGAAHARGIVHGALTSEDVLVGEFGEVLITGWGSARTDHEPRVEALELRVHGALSLEALLAGGERAPDRVGSFVSSTTTSSGAPDPTVDIVAVGRLIGESFRARPLTGDPPALAAITRQAIATTATTGYADVAALVADLRAFLEHRVVRAHRTGFLAELRQWVRRNRTVVATGVCSVVLIASIMIHGAQVEDSNRKELLERAKPQDIELLELAAEALWSSPEDRAAADWRNKTRAWQKALQKAFPVEKTAVVAPEPDTDPSPPPTFEQRRRIARIDGMDPLYRSWDHTRYAALWFEEMAWADLFIDTGVAAPVDIERRGYLEEHLSEYLVTPIPSILPETIPAAMRFVLDGDRDEWRKLRQELLRLRVDELLRDVDEEWSLTGSEPERGMPARGPTKGSEPDVRRALAHIEDWRAECALIDEGIWEEAMLSVLPPERARRFVPRYPLLPLRYNRRTGLWEFWDFRTGEPPVVGTDGELVLDDRGATGMVYVLLPGAPAGDGAPEIEPFFISKYEMTQAQWLRFELTKSYYSPFYGEGEKHGITPRHPTEQKGREAVEWALMRLGLELPTESQWIYAAGAGRTTGFSWGERAEGCEDLANFIGETDGSAIHAPVGSFPPNRNGLFDVHGNVAELCRAGNGATDEWILRGGDWDAAPNESTLESWRPFDEPLSSNGLRPAMELWP